MPKVVQQPEVSKTVVFDGTAGSSAPQQNIPGPTDGQVSVDPSNQVQVVPVTTGDLFTRRVNGNGAVKSITFKSLLTRPLIAMAHTRELLFECSGEIYEHTLPTAGRSDKPMPAFLIDGINIETGEECSLILNAMMKSAFERAKPPLKGRAFGLRSGDVKADKKYRVVDVIEIDVER